MEERAVAKALEMHQGDKQNTIPQKYDDAVEVSGIKPGSSACIEKRCTNDVLERH